MTERPALGSSVVATVPTKNRRYGQRASLVGTVVGFSFARDAAIVRSRAGDGYVETEVPYGLIFREHERR